MTSDRNSWLMWVCVDCAHHHANGECGSCHSEEGHDCEPLSKLADYDLTMGLLASEHYDGCLVYKLDELKRDHPDLEWPDAPGDYECDCHRQTYSTSECEGCGSWLHGEREALTAWERDDEPESSADAEARELAEFEAAEANDERVTDENSPDFRWDVNNLPEAAEWPYVEDAPANETLARSYLRMGIAPCQHCGAMTGH